MGSVTARVSGLPISRHAAAAAARLPRASQATASAITRCRPKAGTLAAKGLQERAVPPADVTVGSKWGYTYTADWRVDADVHEVKEHSAAVLERQWRESSDHLRAGT